MHKFPQCRLTCTCTYNTCTCTLCMCIDTQLYSELHTQQLLSYSVHVHVHVYIYNTAYVDSNAWNIHVHCIIYMYMYLRFTHVFWCLDISDAIEQYIKTPRQYPRRLWLTSHGVRLPRVSDAIGKEEPVLSLQQLLGERVADHVKHCLLRSGLI